MAKHKIRLYCQSMNENIFEVPSFQRTHLLSVMRMRENDKFIAFNERDGEYLCSIESITKNTIVAQKLNLLRAPAKTNKLALAFGLIKQDKVKLIIEKATELGVTDFYPLTTQFTNQTLNMGKLNNISILASEQSERLDIPCVHDVTKFSDFLQNLPDVFLWFSAIERLEHSSFAIDKNSEAIGFIIGPEGGFSNSEKDLLLKKTTPVSISKNVLRSETAAIICAWIGATGNVF